MTAWWCEAKAASANVRRARADHGNIPAAANALGARVPARLLVKERLCRPRLLGSTGQS
jgi:hypothetical protein